MEPHTRKSLQGLRVVCFESRRAKEMAELIRRYDGEPIVAPSMREVPLSENRAALDLLPQIEAGSFDILILMTGVGTKALNEILLTQFAQERIVAALKRLQLVARGPKPIGALKELGLQAALTVPEPNTWREILSTLDARAGRARQADRDSRIRHRQSRAYRRVGTARRAGNVDPDLSLGFARRSGTVARRDRKDYSAAKPRLRCLPTARRWIICCKSPGATSGRRLAAKSQENRRRFRRSGMHRGFAPVRYRARHRAGRIQRWVR